ncbi:MAG: chemotaxis protein CheR [Planctomycetes bacterium]|nr:chemotaxis protein CheR [Planctomycetota bacterium]
MNEALLQNLVLTDRDFRKISNLVYEHCGINLHDGKKELVRARLAKRLRVAKFKTFPEYMRNVLSDHTGREFSVLIDALSTNLTSFFREVQHFQFLKEKFLPALISKKRKKSNFKIRAWSAGCSSGEEPYSIAITLLDAIQGLGRWNVKVLATDISTSMLEIAKDGIYDAKRTNPVSQMQKQKYLLINGTRRQKTFEANHLLKDVVIFKYLNLIKEWPLKGPIDFIFCRNVMIYFDKATQEKLINRFWDLLDSGGILFTGHSESLTGVKHKFEYIQPTIYVKP